MEHTFIVAHILALGAIKVDALHLNDVDHALELSLGGEGGGLG